MSTRQILRGLSLALLVAGVPSISADPLTDALRDPNRPAPDRERDITSKPGAVLQFFGVPEGGVVLDLFAGGGYYSELLARAVGDEGTVYLHNNAAYLGFTGVKLDERLRKNRLTNVIRFDREIDAIDLPDNSVDMVLLVLTYHDLYYKADGWNLDPERFFATVHAVLKPGGVLAVVDHVAPADSGNTAAQELHRIDPGFARSDIESRGFEFAGAATMLENADDPLDISVFDPTVRRRTSRFVYKFVEPGT